MNNTRLTAMLAGVLLAAVAQPAAAAKGPEYSYGELGYTHIDGDQESADGAAMNISFGATDLVFLKFGYSRLSVDFPGSLPDSDANRFQVGGGVHYGITDTIDVLGDISYVDIEYTNGVPAHGDDGYLIEAGVRAMLSKSLEVNATLSSLELDGDNDLGVGIGGVVDVTRKLQASGRYDHFSDSDSNVFFVGLRVEF